MTRPRPPSLGPEQARRPTAPPTRTPGGYPPFNIEQLPPDGFRITLAVAGFADDDLSVTTDDRELVIRGRQADAPEGRVFLHRGIAARAFQRSFVLGEGVQVIGAQLENGLLSIDLRQVQPHQVVQRITISRK